MFPLSLTTNPFFLRTPLMNKQFVRLALAACLISAPTVFCTSSAFAQDQSAVTGGLNGSVTDPSGAAIVGAKVTITGPQGSITTRPTRTAASAPPLCAPATMTSRLSRLVSARPPPFTTK